jgi:hypothetical protein
MSGSFRIGGLSGGVDAMLDLASASDAELVAQLSQGSFSGQSYLGISRTTFSHSFAVSLASAMSRKEHELVERIFGNT